MKPALYLAALFTATALALAVLPGCSDDTKDEDLDMNCGEICADDCWWLEDGNCRCVTPTGEPPLCPV